MRLIKIFLSFLFLYSVQNAVSQELIYINPNNTGNCIRIIDGVVDSTTELLHYNEYMFINTNFKREELALPSDACYEIFNTNIDSFETKIYDLVQKKLLEKEMIYGSSSAIKIPILLDEDVPYYFNKNNYAAETFDVLVMSADELSSKERLRFPFGKIQCMPKS